MSDSDQKASHSTNKIETPLNFLFKFLINMSGQNGGLPFIILEPICTGMCSA